MAGHLGFGGPTLAQWTKGHDMGTQHWSNGQKDMTLAPNTGPMAKMKLVPNIGPIEWLILPNVGPMTHSSWVSV